MHFTSSGFAKGALISVLVVAVAFGLLKSLGYTGSGRDPDDPAVLAQEARGNLEKVRQRKPSDRRPASYDSVMTPLDKLLRQARDQIESDTYDPVADFEKIRSFTVPVIDIAAEAAVQAQKETGPLAKEFRFNDQKGEASQYLANAMWERINARLPRQSTAMDEPPAYPAGEMAELRRVLDAGIEAAQDNRSLFYIRAVVSRAEGLFAAAARDLERAVAIDPGFSAAWNVLGLVRISLKEFDQAEEALERARQLALEEARRFNGEPGAEYTSIIYNLASFHENLAAYYNRENRVHPTVESRRLLDKHTAEARKYLEEFLAREPSGSPDARAAVSRLNALPR